MTFLDIFFADHGDPAVTQEERDALAVRCGLLPHAHFLAEIRPTFRRDLEAGRGKGQTTQQMLTALVRCERGEGSVFLGSFPVREHAQRQAFTLAEAAGLKHSEVRWHVRFLPALDLEDYRLRGLGKGTWVARL